MPHANCYITLGHYNDLPARLKSLQLLQKFPDLHCDLPIPTLLPIALSLAPDDADSLISSASFHVNEQYEVNRISFGRGSNQVRWFLQMKCCMHILTQNLCRFFPQAATLRIRLIKEALQVPRGTIQALVQEALGSSQV